jgi:MFS family permease
MTSKNFKFLLVASFLSSFGDWFYAIALGGLAYSSAGTWGAAWVAAVRYAPSIITPLLSARALQFYSAKSSLIVLDLFRAGLMLGIAVLAQAKQVNALFYILIFLAASAGGLFRPIRMSMLPAALPRNELQGFYGKDGFLNTLSLIAAPALGGVLASAVGVVGLLVLNSLSFVASAALLRWVALHDEKNSAGPSKESGSIRLLPIGLWGEIALYSLSHVLVGATWAILPRLADQLTHGSSTGLGLLTSWVGAFSALGMLRAGSGKVPRKDQASALAILVFGIFFAGLALLDFQAVTVVVNCLVSLAGAVYCANLAEPWIWTHWQETIPNEQKPRAFGLIDSMSVAGLLLGSLATGWLSRKGFEALAIQGLAFVVVVFSAAFWFKRITLKGSHASV